MQNENEKYECQYKLAYKRPAVGTLALNDCNCSPLLAELGCHCTALSHHWQHDEEKKRIRPPRQHGLIAYIRADSYLSADQQRRIINDFCHCNNYFIKATYTDTGSPAAGLHAALRAIDKADGLIAADLNRFVEFSDDRLRELRPFVHHFFCHPDKRLISVQEGVDTGSVLGQENVVSIMNHVKEFS